MVIPSKNIVVLISGRGSNMRSLVTAGLPVTAVISNKPDVGGLQFAQAKGIATAVLDHRAYPSREAFDAALAELIEQYQADLVVLAGFMRVLTPGFVDRFAGRLMNIHPSLLPSFPGLHTHKQALDTGVRLHGCTVHFVTSELDHGPVVIQAAVPVLAGDTESSLAERVLEQEHRIYPAAVRWFVEDRLTVQDGRVSIRDIRCEGRALCVPDPDCSTPG